jgi:UDP-glucose 4-epimerase
VDVVDDLSTGSLTNLADARSGSTNDMTFHHLDVRSPQLVDLMARRPPEVVFHLAAQADVRVSVDDPVLDADINILGSLRVLEGARRAGVSKIVFAASGGTLYGDVRPSDLPARESLPRVPTSPYGISKMVVVDYLTAYRELHNIEFCALALGNVYGPRQDPHGEAGVVAIFAGHLVAGERCTVFGDGSQTRDFVFVDDVVDAMARAGQRGGGLLINVGTGTETSVLQLYETMASEAGSSQRPVHAPARPGELHRSALHPGRAAIHLGWKPWTSLADGTAAVLAATSPEDAGGGAGRPAKAGRGSRQRKRSS